mmetsp:Transcript_68935/g.197715  ORF Transcript_68935/g.197715 Transcript_68935/m.197715 type:complete len:209 (-) Transcript_68935:96-722(-)
MSPTSAQASPGSSVQAEGRPSAPAPEEAPAWRSESRPHRSSPASPSTHSALAYSHNKPPNPLEWEVPLPRPPFSSQRDRRFLGPLLLPPPSSSPHREQPEGEAADPSLKHAESAEVDVNSPQQALCLPRLASSSSSRPSVEEEEQDGEPPDAELQDQVLEQSMRFPLLTSPLQDSSTGGKAEGSYEQEEAEAISVKRTSADVCVISVS